MKSAPLSLALGAALVAAPSLATDIGTYPPAPPPESLYPFNQYNQTATDAPVAPVVRQNQIRANPLTREVPAQRGAHGVTVDPVTGIVTTPGYMGPNDSKGQ